MNFHRINLQGKMLCFCLFLIEEKQQLRRNNSVEEEKLTMEDRKTITAGAIKWERGGKI